MKQISVIDNRLIQLPKLAETTFVLVEVVKNTKNVV